MKRSLASVSALLFTLALLAGCAGRAPAPESQMRGQWSDQQSRLEAMNNWQLTGKVGLRTPEDSVSANLDWWQSPTYYRLLLSGPFGSGRSTLEGNDQGVTLITSEGRFQADTPEALMEEQLGGRCRYPPWTTGYAACRRQMPAISARPMPRAIRSICSSRAGKSPIETG